MTPKRQSWHSLFPSYVGIDAKDVDAYLIKGIIDSGDPRFTQDLFARMEELRSTFEET